MALQVSSGFKSQILGPSAFEDIFLNGAIQIYTGPQPTTADAASQGTWLGTITMSGLAWVPGAATGGLRFLRTGPYISNYPQDNWVLTPIAAGTASWWRLVSNNDDGAEVSFSLPRVDGAIKNDSSAEMLLANTTLVPGTAVRIQSFFYTIPPIVGA